MSELPVLYHLSKFELLLSDLDDDQFIVSHRQTQKIMNSTHTVDCVLEYIWSCSAHIIHTSLQNTITPCHNLFPIIRPNLTSSDPTCTGVNMQCYHRNMCQSLSLHHTHRFPLQKEEELSN